MRNACLTRAMLSGDGSMSRSISFVVRAPPRAISANPPISTYRAPPPSPSTRRLPTTFIGGIVPLCTYGIRPERLDDLAESLYEHAEAIRERAETLRECAEPLRSCADTLHPIA